MSFSQTLPKPLDVLLSETLSQLRSYVYLERVVQDEKESDSAVKNIEYGKCNSVRLQPHPVSRQLYDSATFTPLSKEEPKIKIAVSTTRVPDDREHEQTRKEDDSQTEAVVKLLSSFENNDKNTGYLKQSSTLFIQHLLYCGPGRKISIAAESDLYDWLEAHIDKKDFTEAELKKTIALTLSAVYSLHSGLMVHRDIKFENFLIHPVLKNYIELADLDTITSIYVTETPDSYTPGYISPECRTTANKKLINPTKARFDRDLYETIAKKPIDCYAIGHSIHMFADNISNPSISDTQIDLLVELALGLKNPDPAKRLTIVDAMAHPYFGPDEITRKAYFDALRKEYQYDIFYDGYYYDRKHFYPAFGDAFFILPKWIKKLYFQVASLQTQIKLISQDYPPMDESHFQAIHKQIEIVNHSLKKMDRLDESHDALKDILGNLQECTQQAETLLKSVQPASHSAAEENNEEIVPPAPKRRRM